MAVFRGVRRRRCSVEDAQPSWLLGQSWKARGAAGRVGLLARGSEVVEGERTSRAGDSVSIARRVRNSGGGGSVQRRSMRCVRPGDPGATDTVSAGGHQRIERSCWANLSFAAYVSAPTRPPTATCQLHPLSKGPAGSAQQARPPKKVEYRFLATHAFTSCCARVLGGRADPCRAARLFAALKRLKSLSISTRASQSSLFHSLPHLACSRFHHPPPDAPANARKFLPPTPAAGSVL